jgi:hypothetical protein
MNLKTLAVGILSLSIAGGALAQGRGGGMSGGGGMGGGMGTGNQGGGMINGMGAMQEIVVAEDGSAILVRHLETDAVGQFEVVAIRTSGATGWSYKLPTLGAARVELAGTNVLAVQQGQGLGNQGTPPTTPVAPKTKLTAISQASGAAVWTLDLDGMVGDVEEFSGGIYLTVTKPATDASGAPIPRSGNGTRSLLAISNAGSVLWTVALN